MDKYLRKKINKLNVSTYAKKVLCEAVHGVGK